MAKSMPAASQRGELNSRKNTRRILTSGAILCFILRKQKEMSRTIPMVILTHEITIRMTQNVWPPLQNNAVFFYFSEISLNSDLVRSLANNAVFLKWNRSFIEFKKYGFY